MLRVKMSGEEKRRAQSLADVSGINLSSLVRMLLHEKYEARRKRRGKRVVA